jgi:hypothetical protein
MAVSLLSREAACIPPILREAGGEVKEKAGLA